MYNIFLLGAISDIVHSSTTKLSYVAIVGYLIITFIVSP